MWLWRYIIQFYIVANVYLWWGLFRCVRKTGAFGWTVQILFALLVVSYPVARLWDRAAPNAFASWLIEIGAFYLAPMMCTLVLSLAVDLVRLADKIFHFLPRFLFEQPHLSARLVGLVVVAISVGLSLAGTLNARYPVVRRFDIEIQKNAPGRTSLDIAVISDLHVDAYVSDSEIRRMLLGAARLRPDILLILGDMIDAAPEKISPTFKQTLQQLAPPLGVWAIQGNHDIYSGWEGVRKYLESAGVKILYDQVASPDGSFLLAGRADAVNSRYNVKRKELEEILSGYDRALPTILMDHQPIALEKAQEQGVDLQLSGHTHNGQIFPLNFVVKALFEKAYGFYRRGETQYIVTCGTGYWGPPVRTTSRPEILLLHVRFKK